MGLSSSLEEDCGSVILFGRRVWICPPFLEEDCGSVLFGGRLWICPPLGRRLWIFPPLGGRVWISPPLRGNLWISSTLYMFILQLLPFRKKKVSVLKSIASNEYLVSCKRCLSIDFLMIQALINCGKYGLKGIYFVLMLRILTIQTCHQQSTDSEGRVIVLRT